jgi:cytochrome c biogenesis protein CcmG/thiol:disulfide interchange protein DsbE
MQRRQKSSDGKLGRSVVLSLVVAGLLLGTGCNRGQLPRELGEVAPAFTIHDGPQAVSLSQYRGQVVLVTFWASYCAPCMEEFPSLLALHQRLPQLKILGVSIDENAQAYRNFLVAYHVDFPTIRDPSQAVMHRYGTVQIPEAYVINRSGHIVRKYVSAQDWNDPEIYRTLSATLNAKH